MRLPAHARLALSRPDAALVTNVGACALRCHQGFFICEAAPTEQTGQSGGSRADAMLVPESGGQLRHGDVGRGLDGLDQNWLVGRQLARATGPALARRGGRSGLPLAPDELDREAVADPEVAGRRPAGMAGRDKARDAHAKIQGIAAPHDPPPRTRRESHLATGQKLTSLVSSPML